MNERSSDLGGDPTEALPEGISAQLESMGQDTGALPSHANTLAVGSSAEGQALDPLAHAAPGSQDLDAQQARAKVAGALFGNASGTDATTGDPGAGVAVGRYQIIDKLGAGGMGVVYRARDPELEREVALKVLTPDTVRDELAQRRMLREARALARLSHPNVVQVYDVGTQGEQVFLAMEYVAGCDLAAWLDAGSRATSEVLDCFLQAAAGLAAAHARGMVHRDFKPANVLVGDDGRVRVVDFGLARPIEASALPMLDGATTQTGALVGTPMYMAPEQFEGKPADARSDQFAFCVALFTAAFGTRPFVGDNVAAYVSNVVQGRLVRPEHIADGPDRARLTRLLEVLERGLRVAPGERYRNMDDLIAALSAASDPAAAPAAARRGGRFVAVGAALLAIGLGVWFAFGRQPPQSSKDAAAASVGAESPETLAQAGETSTDASPGETDEDGVADEADDTGDTGDTGATGETGERHSENETGDAGETGEVTPEANDDAAGPVAASSSPKVRDYCAFHEDSYKLLRRGRKKPTRLEHAGACYACRAERRRSRISRLVPGDCGAFYMCSKQKDGDC